MRHPNLLSILLLILAAGCHAGVVDEAAITPTPVFVTATLPPTSIPQATLTPAPPSATPTLPPVEGTTTTQVNVRAETTTASESLGVIAAFAKVQISGQDASGGWYRIIFAESPSGGGWVRTEYVRVDAAAEIPVVLPAPGSGSGASGLVIQRINIRNGAGTEFESLGVLNPGDVVLVTGRDARGAWFQIEFTNSPDGKGWAASQFLQVEDAERLPAIDAEAETEVAEEIETPPGFFDPAIQDGDSMQSPLVSAVFTPGGIRAIQVESDLSTPLGDLEDWVEFSAFGAGVVIELSCLDDGLRVELWNDNDLQDAFTLACGEEKFLRTSTGDPQWLRLSLPPAGEFFAMRYKLIISIER